MPTAAKGEELVRHGPSSLCGRTVGQTEGRVVSTQNIQDD
jgi:hypothetical protein